jgi:Tfp pilus assembly protein PilO
MNLESREKGFLIAGLLGALVFLLLEFVALPQWGSAESSSNRLFLAQKELRYSRELLAAKQLRELEVVLRGRLEEQEHRLLVATDSNEAGAQLQRWLADHATEQQLGLVRSEFLPPVPLRDNYIRIPVRLELSGRITQLTQFLTGVTSGDRITEIEELQLSGGSDKEKRVHCVVVIAAVMAKPK